MLQFELGRRGGLVRAVPGGAYATPWQRVSAPLGQVPDAQPPIPCTAGQHTCTCGQAELELQSRSWKSATDPAMLQRGGRMLESSQQLESGQASQSLGLSLQQKPLVMSKQYARIDMHRPYPAAQAYRHHTAQDCTHERSLRSHASKQAMHSFVRLCRGSQSRFSQLAVCQARRSCGPCWALLPLSLITASFRRSYTCTSPLSSPADHLHYE